MTEATLGFAREDATEETFRETDLAALYESVVADAADIDKDASFTAPTGERVVASCGPIALRRALRNIVDNALAYGTARAFQLSVRTAPSPLSTTMTARAFRPPRWRGCSSPLSGWRNRATGRLAVSVLAWRSRAPSCARTAATWTWKTAPKAGSACA
ncbi:MAG: hypothetical protein VW338_07395 [Rhodospirillaceae bacterium]